MNQIINVRNSISCVAAARMGPLELVENGCFVPHLTSPHTLLATLWLLSMIARSYRLSLAWWSHG